MTTAMAVLTKTNTNVIHIQGFKRNKKERTDTSKKTVIPYRLQSEEFRRHTMEAIMDEDD